MAVEYTRRAYPTNYRGIRFRSRLEATWAAFFDLLEWQWEYEPFDLGGWSPDFLIKGAKVGTLVEVKPTAVPDESVKEKMVKWNLGQYRLLYCGVGLKVEQDHMCMLHTNCCSVNEVCPHPGGYWMDRFVAQIDGKFDVIFGHDGRFEAMVSGEDADYFNKEKDITYFEGREVQTRWSAAKNKTQWIPR